MLLTSFVFRNGQSWVTVPLFSSFPWLGLSSAWWRIGSRSLGTSGFVVSPFNLQVFRQHSTLYLCTSGVPTTRRQYGAEPFTLGALFLAHMAMAGSACLNVEMILRVIPPLKSNGWLVLLPHRLCWTWSSAVAHASGCSTQRCRCRNCKGHFDWNEVCLCTNCENQYIITCQSSASSLSHHILSCNMVSCQAEILPASVSFVNTGEKSLYAIDYHHVFELII